MNIRDLLLEEPDLHDGNLTGIEITGAVLRLSCQTDSGQVVALEVPEVVRLRVDNFLEGNIILDVEVFTGESCPEEFILRCYGANIAQEGAGRLVQDARRNGWTLLHISTSYGCELTALAKGGLRVVV